MSTRCEHASKKPGYAAVFRWAGVDRPMDGELFLGRVEQFRCPALQTGNIVILENHSSHKVNGIQRLSITHKLAMRNGTSAFFWLIG